MGDAPAAAAAPSPAGKRRRGGEEGLRRVAEIVMVLAAAGEVRGGREPTAAERALVLEARERLAAAVAEGAVRPKDLFPGEAVRAVVEDLGLNRAKDPASMGFRPPKASIADRLMLTKRKMEEAKEAPAQPISAPQTIVSSGMSEFQGLHGASKFGVGAPRNPPAATAPLNSASLVTLKPPGSSPAKPLTNSSAGALPHTGPAHLKLEKDVNGPLNLACSGATIVHSAKSTPNTFARTNVNAVQSSNQVVKNQDTKPVVIQAATGNSVSGHRATPGAPPKPTFAHHNDIARSVQQFLHQAMNHPSWTPPSTEYMSSRLCCQICKVVISDADSLLVCDACERGAHLICLQNYGNKGVPKPEWHCSVCLTQSKGKPLPPKYGKVTRTAVTSKAAPPVNGAQFSLQGSAETMSTKEDYQKLAANGNPTRSISTQACSTVHNSNVLALSATTAGSQLVSNLRPSVGNNVKPEASSSEKEGIGQACSSTVQNNTNPPPNKRLRSDASLNSVGSANDIMHAKKTEEIYGVKCADNSSAFGSNIKLEAHSEPLPSRDEEMVDHSETQMEQTRTVATEERPRTEATFEPEKVKYWEKTTNAGTSTDQSTNFATEEKNQGQSTSEPHTISEVEITAPTGTPICQSSNVATEEKLKADAASEQNGIKDTEMSTNNAPQIDQVNNLAIEEKPSKQTSALNDVEFTNYAGTPTNQSQHANEINGNGIKEPPYGDKNKSGCNAVSDHGSTQPAVPNGVLDAKDEMLFVRENETVSVSVEAKEPAN